MAYIDREIFINNELIPLVKRLDLCHPKQKKGVLMAIQKLNEEPIADVVEVKHGYWKQTKEPLGYSEVDCVECSCCGESWIIDEDLGLEEYTQGWNYCLNCGAKIDLVGDDNGNL